VFRECRNELEVSKTRDGDIVNYDSNHLFYFMAGLGIGVAVGVLVAPTSGSDTRAVIRHTAQDGADYVRQRTDDLRSTVADAVDRSTQTVQKQIEVLSSAVEAGAQAYRQEGNAQQSG